MYESSLAVSQPHIQMSTCTLTAVHKQGEFLAESRRAFYTFYAETR